MKKQRLTIIGTGIALGLLSFFVLRLSGDAVPFAPRAATENQQVLEQKSAEPLPIPTDELPKCVKKGEYLPGEDGKVCYVYVSCASNATHTMQGSTCVSLQEWMIEAGKACGC